MRAVYIIGQEQRRELHHILLKRDPAVRTLGCAEGLAVGGI